MRATKMRKNRMKTPKDLLKNNAREAAGKP